jgi:hypothetical protein
MRYPAGVYILRFAAQLINVGVCATSHHFIIHSTNILLTVLVQGMQLIRSKQTTRVQRREITEHWIASLCQSRRLAVIFALIVNPVKWSVWTGTVRTHEAIQ